MLDRVLLTNTVPFKPPGNKAYSTAVKERFRPFLAELLVTAIGVGTIVITLGNEAFQWFSRRMPIPRAFEELLETGQIATSRRFGCEMGTSAEGAKRVVKSLITPCLCRIPRHSMHAMVRSVSRVARQKVDWRRSLSST